MPPTVIRRGPKKAAPPRASPPADAAPVGRNDAAPPENAAAVNTGAAVASSSDRRIGRRREPRGTRRWRSLYVSVMSDFLAGRGVPQPERRRASPRSGT